MDHLHTSNGHDRKVSSDQSLLTEANDSRFHLFGSNIPNISLPAAASHNHASVGSDIPQLSQSSQSAVQNIALSNGQVTSTQLQVSSYSDSDEDNATYRETASYSSNENSHRKSLNQSQGDHLHTKIGHSSSRPSLGPKRGSLPKTRKRRGSGSQEIAEDLGILSNPHSIARCLLQIGLTYILRDRALKMARRSGDLERLRRILPQGGEDVPNSCSFTV